MLTISYLHVVSVILLMLVDAAIAYLFKKKYKIIKSLIIRTVWPLHAIIFLIVVYVATNKRKAVTKPGDA